MTITPEDIRDQAYNSLGLYPVWEDQDVVDASSLPGYPEPASGVSIPIETVVTLVALRLRQLAHTMTSWVTVLTVLDTTTYTVTLGGVPFQYLSDGDATKEEIIAGLAGVINASPNYSASSVIIDTEPTVEITGADNNSYTIAVDANLAETHEADTVTARIWAKPQTNEDESYYFLVNNTTISISNGQNWLERIEIGGIQRMFIEVLTTDGLVTPMVGPCGAPY